MRHVRARVTAPFRYAWRDNKCWHLLAAGRVGHAWLRKLLGKRFTLELTGLRCLIPCFVQCQMLCAVLLRSGAWWCGRQTVRSLSATCTVHSGR